MSWSMDSVSFRMSGSGSWQNLLPDEASRRLYAGIYPRGASVPYETGHLRMLLPSWEQAAIVQFEKEKVVPLGPIMTDEDLTILKPWCQDISNIMCQAVMERLDDYRVMAMNLAKGHSPRKLNIDNLLTILICALTLDSWVFSGLRREMIGPYPNRDFAGNCFFWGYAFATGPQKIFGFTTYNGLEGKQLHIIRSHGLDRRSLKIVLHQRKTWVYLDYLFSSRGVSGKAAPFGKEQDGSLIKIEDLLQSVGLLTSDNPLRLAIPIFDDFYKETISELCRKISKKIMGHLMFEMDGLKYLMDQCSFAQCSRPDVLCMLFHLAYSYAADQLVDKGVIPDFPKSAGGEWGVWIS